MQKIKAIIRTDRLQNVIDALHALSNMPGVTVSAASGFGRRRSGAGAGAFDQSVGKTGFVGAITHRQQWTRGCIRCT